MHRAESERVSRQSFHSPLLKFFRFDLNFVQCPTASWNVSDFDSCSSRKLFFENLGHFELPLSLRGKHALGTVAKKKPAGSAEQRRCCGGSPHHRARPTRPAVSVPFFTTLMDAISRTALRNWDDCEVRITYHTNLKGEIFLWIGIS